MAMPNNNRKPIPAEIRQRLVGNVQRQQPADGGKRHSSTTISASRIAERAVEQQEDPQDGQQHDHHQLALGDLHLVELAVP